MSAEPTPGAQPTITLDITTLTLGEMAECERQSGHSFEKLLTGRASRKIVATFVAEWRSSDSVPSWQEVSSRRLFDSSSSTPRSPSDDPSPK